MREIHHHRSKTLMSCINQVTKTHCLHENLQKIYSKRCKCQAEYNQQRQKSEQRNMSDQSIQREGQKYRNVKWVKRDGKCMKCNARFVTHQKISELHRKNFHSEINRKNQQLYNKNRKIVHRLINTKSIVPKANNLTQNSNGKIQIQTIQNNNNSPIKKRVNNKIIQSSSAVNRRKQSKRIQSENRNLQKRLVSAMKKSKYSQKIKQQHSTRSHTQFARRTIFNTQNQRNFSAFDKMNRTTKDKNYESENNGQLFSIIDTARNTTIRRIQSHQGRTYTEGDLIIKNSSSKKQKVYGSQLMRVLQQSLDQINGHKQTDSRRENKLERSQSIQKMRKAAMIHYRKLQKMKQTQSKFRKYPMKFTFDKNDRIKNLTMTEYMPIQDRVTKENQNSLLLTEII